MRVWFSYLEGRLSLKTAVVTGGGSGIGLAIAERLLADGYRVATLDLNPGGKGLALESDVTDRAQVDRALATVAERLGPVAILVNAVPPGFIDTPMLRRAEERGRLGGPVARHIEQIPVRRIGRPEDIAAACAFLVSEEAGYITGQILGVNGGRNT
jgi:2-hydroxycyclohexanecarboxyl-CoA dehydrogenase